MSRTSSWRGKLAVLWPGWVAPVALATCALAPVLLGHLIDLPELVRSFLALPLLVLVPLRLGRLGLRAIKHWIRGWALAVDSLPGGFVAWLLGVYLLTMTALFFQRLALLWAVKSLPWLAFALVLADLCYDVFRSSGRSSAGRLPSTALADVGVLLLILGISVIPVLIYKRSNPFPYIHVDAFGLPKLIVQPVRRIIRDGYVMDNLPVHKSGLIVPLAAAAALVNADALSVLWSGPFLLYPVLALGLYVWTYELSKSKVQAVLVVLCGMFLLSGAPNFQGIPLKLRSSTVQYALYPWLLYLVHKIVPRDKLTLGENVGALAGAGVTVLAFFAVVNVQRFIGGLDVGDATFAHTLFSMALPVIALVLRGTLYARSKARDVFVLLVFATTLLFQFHVFEAPLHLFALFVYAGLGQLVRVPRARPVLWIAIGLFWLFLTLQLTGIVEIPQTEMLSHAIFGDEMARDRDDLSYKWTNVATAHTPLVLVLIALGGLFSAVVGGQVGLLVVSMMSIMSFLFFLPESTGIRWHKQMAPFVSYALAWILFTLYELLRTRLPDRKKGLAVLLFALLVAVIVPNLVLPFYDHYTAEPSSDGTYPSILADYDYLAVDWLRENSARDVRLVSDYYTMQVVSEMADKVTLVEPPIHPATLTDQGRAHLRLVKDRVFLETEASRARDAIYELADASSYSQKYLQWDYLAATGQSMTDVSFAVVLTGRTVRWIQQDDLQLVNSRAEIGIDVDPSYLQKFYDLRYFEPLYQVGERLYVFGVKPPLGDGGSQALRLVDQGNVQWAGRDQEAAIRLYESALDVDPLEAEAYIALGEAYAARADYARAGEMFGKAAGLKPTDAHLLFRQGALYERQGDLQAAIQAYERAAALAPGFREPHLALGRAYLQDERPDAALEQFEAALRSYAEDAELHADLGLAYAALGEQAQAEKAYRKAVELGVNKPGFYYDRVGSLALAAANHLQTDETPYIAIKAGPEIREWLEAQPALFSVLYPYPDQPGDGLQLYRVFYERLSTQVERGYAAVQEQRWEQAAAGFATALEDDPSDVWARIGLGRTYQAQGQMAQALTAYGESLRACSGREARDVAAALSLYLGMAPQYLEPYLASPESYHRPANADLEDSKWVAYRLLDDACLAAVPGEHISRSAFIIDQQPRGVLFQHPPSELSCPIVLREPASLRFSLGLAPEAWQLGLGDGVQFEIQVDDGTAQKRLFSEYIDPKNVRAHRQWNDRELDLEPGAGGVVTITFSTGPGPGGSSDYDWAGWGEPRLVQPIAYDLLRELPSAERSGGGEEQVQSGTLRIGHESRPVLLQGPAGQVVFRLEIPERARLHFGLGLDPQVWSRDESAGIEYNIYLRRMEGASVLRRVFHAYLDPTLDPGDRRWLDQVVDLGAYAGERVELIFEALSGAAPGADIARGGWSHPVLVTDLAVGPSQSPH